MGRTGAIDAMIRSLAGGTPLPAMGVMQEKQTNFVGLWGNRFPLVKA
jgi:hypothetical protein